MSVPKHLTSPYKVFVIEIMKDKQNILKRRDNEGLTASNGSERSAWFSLDMIPVKCKG